MVEDLDFFFLTNCCSTFGNALEPTSNLMEVTFSITAVLSGLMLFTLLIGNIQVILECSRVWSSIFGESLIEFVM